MRLNEVGTSKVVGRKKFERQSEGKNVPLAL